MTLPRHPALARPLRGRRGVRVVPTAARGRSSDAGGRLVGSRLSGLMSQLGGVAACLWASVVFAAVAGSISCELPRKDTSMSMADMKTEGSE